MDLNKIKKSKREVPPEELAVKKGGTLPLLAFPLLFLSLFFFFPLISILIEGLTDESGRFTLIQVGAILNDRYYLRVIGFTAEQAILSTLASVLLGLPGAYILARFDFLGKSLIKALTTVPFVLPSIRVHQDTLLRDTLLYLQFR